ncbi:uncharacterized protein RSE6_08659 [Rhynchosporium secalis]|uniref:Uncharacterized protein n=1 Tax=Rhynchosporium secalis TaxID=38038 RepID=A0A1E1MFY0_RHYSE|nr:uncharacterized protein RSE6_08659 [Rhynchosporium secalis]
MALITKYFAIHFNAFLPAAAQGRTDVINFLRSDDVKDTPAHIQKLHFKFIANGYSAFKPFFMLALVFADLDTCISC